MLDFEQETAEDLHEEFAAPIFYTGAGLADAVITAIRSEIPADDFQGPGSTARQISFEIRKSDLPERPRKGELIVEGLIVGGLIVKGAISWAVNDITDRGDIDAWSLVVVKS